MGRRGKATQFLKYPSAAPTGSGTTTLFQASDFGIPITRPAKARSIELEYFSPEPRAFNLVVFAGNGEEIYQSDTMLSGPIPRKRSFKLPNSTDFSTYSTAASPVVRFNHANGAGLRLVMNIGIEHKSIPIGIYF